MTEETLMDLLQGELYNTYKTPGIGWNDIIKEILKWFEGQMEELEKEVENSLKIIGKMNQHKIDITEPKHKLIERDLLRNGTRAKRNDSIAVQMWLKRKIPLEGD